MAILLGRDLTHISCAVQKHLGAAIMSAGCRLVELDLSDNAFGPRGIEGVVDLLKSPSCYSLQVLRLNNNGLGIGGGKMRHGFHGFVCWPGAACHLPT